MPTLDCVAAGSMPRSVSSAFARMAARCTAVGVPGALRVARARSAPASRGIHFAYTSNAASIVLHVPLAQRALELRGDVIPPAPVQLVGVRHVARGLLEIRHQPAPLEHLRQDVGDVLARDVRAAELRDRVVAVFVEHSRVQLLGARRLRPLAAVAPASRRPCPRTRRGTAAAATSPIASSARRAPP